MLGIGAAWAGTWLELLRPARPSPAVEQGGERHRRQARGRRSPATIAGERVDGDAVAALVKEHD